MTTINFDVLFLILPYCDTATFGLLLRLNKAVNSEMNKQPRLLVQLYQHTLLKLPKEALPQAFERSICAAVTSHNHKILLPMIDFQFDTVKLPYWLSLEFVTTDTDESALCRAAEVGNLQACEALIHHFTSCGASLSLYGASKNNQLETFQYLVTFIHQLDEGPYEALMLVPIDLEWFGSRAGPPSNIIAYMLGSMLMAFPEIVDSVVSIFRGMIRWALQRGGEVDQLQLRSALEVHPKIFNLLLTQENANTALVAAADIGDCKGLQLALLKGADVQCDDGVEALRLARQLGHSEAVEFLEKIA
ncbi:hypothetical protein HDV00_005014 [Rhizophlyctis rosea]|nr:hypothetical protein HDV00_005014 [Rhizophlyctis rosea]